jgi:hypothetical protein
LVLVFLLESATGLKWEDIHTSPSTVNYKCPFSYFVVSVVLYFLTFYKLCVGDIDFKT